MVTLHQLRIFWAVAHANTLTKASKQLGLTQPSLSQNLSKLETVMGSRLFDRSGGKLELTDAGRFLLLKSESILASVDEAVAGVQEIAKGISGRITVGGLNSIVRLILPQAFSHISDNYPNLDIDIHELAPQEAIDLLYGRRLNIAVLAANSIASDSLSFHQVDILSDPYVLAVPRGIDLATVRDVDAELPEDQRRIVNRCIQFNFATQHTQRVAQWYHEVLPHHRLVAQSRTYEMALSMVEAGIGVALVPALALLVGHKISFDVSTFLTDLPERRIVALMPSQYARVQPYAAFLQALQDSGRNVHLPETGAIPPFLRTPEA